jgi:hypothetical protein
VVRQACFLTACEAQLPAGGGAGRDVNPRAVQGKDCSQRPAAQLLEVVGVFVLRPSFTSRLPDRLLCAAPSPPPVVSACPNGQTLDAGVCKCGANTYKDGQTCTACPAGTNSTAGSTSAADCGEWGHAAKGCTGWVAVVVLDGTFFVPQACFPTACEAQQPAGGGADRCVNPHAVWGEDCSFQGSCTAA